MRQITVSGQAGPSRECSTRLKPSMEHEQMPGRHAKPTTPLPRAITRTLAAALPSVVAAGAVAGSAAAGPASAATAEHQAQPDPHLPAVTAAPVVRKAPARVKDPLYKVRSGDTLSAIAQRLCHKAADWTGIYKRNHKTIGADPNLILPGQALAIACRQAAISAGAGPSLASRRTTSHVSGYAFPFRHVAGLIWERIDEGVDFSGAGPVYALGPGTVTYVSTASSWPGGNFIAYQLHAGPLAGKYIYVAENITPAVAVGQHVNSATVVGHMFSGGYGIETGFAMPPGNTDTPAAYGHYSEGQPTPEGNAFHAVLTAAHHHHLALATASAGAGRHGGSDGDSDGSGGTAAPPRASVSGVVSMAGLSSFEACVIQRESGGDPTAQNPVSTASGLFGFLDSTWTAVTGLPGPARDYSVATQERAFAREYAIAGTAPWARYDGC